MTRFRLACIAALILLAPLSAVATVISFDEFGTSSPIDVNGLDVFGVTFSFSPGVATYNGAIGTAGDAVLVSDPLLVGPTSGTLTLGFDQAVRDFSFDIVLQSVSPLGDSASSPDGGPAYTVSLSSGSVFTGSTAPQPGGIYSEGFFAYAGAPISTATITFFQGLDDNASPVLGFGLDNLTFDGGNSDSSTVTPEPGAWALIVVGLAGLALTTRKKLTSK